MADDSSWIHTSLVVDGVRHAEKTKGTPIYKGGIFKGQCSSVIHDNKITNLTKTEPTTANVKQLRLDVARLNQEFKTVHMVAVSGEKNNTVADSDQRTGKLATKSCNPPPVPPKKQQAKKSVTKDSLDKPPHTIIIEKPSKCKPPLLPKPNRAMVKVLLEGTSTSSCTPSENLVSSEVEVTKQGLQLLEEKCPILEAVHAQQQGLPSDSYDADYDEELASVGMQNCPMNIRPFSVEQKDISSRLLNSRSAKRRRQLSDTVLAVYDKSNCSVGEAQNDISKGYNDVFDKLINHTGVLGSAKEHVSNKNVAAATVYPEEEVPVTAGNRALTGSSIGSRHKVTLIHAGADQWMSNKSCSSELFIENDLYSNEGGISACGNMFSGSIGARNVWNSCSLEPVEDKSECVLSDNMDVVVSPTQTQAFGEISEEAVIKEDVKPIETSGCEIYENVTFKEPSDDIYANVEFMSIGYQNWGVWRWQHITQKPKLKYVRNQEDEDDQDGELEFINNNSEGSFDSGSFTDTSEEAEDEEELKEEDVEEETVEPVYGNIQCVICPEQLKVPRTDKLKLIATELVTTEQTYVKRLHLIDQVFHFKIVIENREHHMFPEDVIPQMFSNIKSIYQFHKDFLLPQLKKRMDDWDNNPKLGDLMHKFAPFLKLYSEYIKNFNHGTNTINTWMKRSHKFENIINELQKKPECGMMTLQHHMLEPIQRVPRYEMLLKDYVSHLPEESEDKADSKKALEQVTTAAAHANETMWKIDKFRKLLQLNEMLGGMVNLIDPSRELIKEGKIIKISAGKGLQCERYLFLFTDMLMLCTIKRMGLKQRYKINNLLNVNGMQVQKGDNLKIPLTFYVKSKSKIIELHTKTEEEMTDWYFGIEKAISDYNQRQNSRLQGIKLFDNDDKLGACAPKWVKDDITSTCMLCETGFTVLKRRHHCRCCGIVVCGDCSSQKAPLTYLDDKLGRVCDTCYKNLSRQAGNDDPLIDSNPNVKGVLQVDDRGESKC